MKDGGGRCLYSFISGWGAYISELRFMQHARKSYL